MYPEVKGDAILTHASASMNLDSVKLNKTVAKATAVIPLPRASGTEVAASLAVTGRGMRRA